MSRSGKIEKFMEKFFFDHSPKIIKSAVSSIVKGLKGESDVISKTTTTEVMATKWRTCEKYMFCGNLHGKISHYNKQNKRKSIAVMP